MFYTQIITLLSLIVIVDSINNNTTSKFCIQSLGYAKILFNTLVCECTHDYKGLNCEIEDFNPYKKLGNAILIITYTIITVCVFYILFKFVHWVYINKYKPIQHQPIISIKVLNPEIV